MIVYKSPKEIEKIRAAGAIVKETLKLLFENLRPGITTGRLDEIAEDYIRSRDAVPSFKGYNGFPGSICVSIDNEVVHGIPGPRKIKEGQIVGIDVGAFSVLERYQRWRRFDTMAMRVATDGLKRLFSNNSDVLRLARDVGLGIVDRLPNVKDFFIREAAGVTGDVPKLLKGEAL